MKKQHATKKQAAPKAATKKTAPVKDQAPARPVPGPGEIVIAMSSAAHDGPEWRVVQAEVVGEFFGVHVPPVQIPGVRPKPGYDVTHIPTGLRFGHYKQRALAVWVAEQLRAHAGAEVWDFSVSSEARDRTAPVREKLTFLSSESEAHAAWRTAVAQPKTIDPTATTTGRAAVDWVAAGKKAYETRLRNQAARAAAEAAAKAQADAEAQAAQAPAKKARKSKAPVSASAPA